MLEKKLKTDHKRIREDDVDPAFQWIDLHFSLGHDAFSSQTKERILDLAEREANSERGLQGLIIDPYNFIDKASGKELETNYISSLLSDIKSFAYKRNVHVWVVAHPTKSSSWNDSTSRPNLYDISGSANWYNKADMGVIVERKVLVVGDDMIQESKIHLHIDKVRNKDAGKLGKVELVFDADTRGYVERDIKKTERFQDVPEALGVLS